MAGGNRQSNAGVGSLRSFLRIEESSRIAEALEREKRVLRGRHDYSAIEIPETIAEMFARRESHEDVGGSTGSPQKGSRPRNDILKDSLIFRVRRIKGDV